MTADNVYCVADTVLAAASGAVLTDLPAYWNRNPKSEHSERALDATEDSQALSKNGTAIPEVAGDMAAFAADTVAAIASGRRFCLTSEWAASLSAEAKRALADTRKLPSQAENMHTPAK